MTTHAKAEIKSIPWNQILVPEEGNMRHDLPKIKELAEDLKEKGQLLPIGVENGGEGAKPYKLVWGFRRMAAYELNGWTDETIDAKVRHYNSGDVTGRIIDNWTENAHEDVSPLDQADLIYKLSKGAYVVAEGEQAHSCSRAEISKMLGISQGNVGKFLKLHECIDDEIKAMARKLEAPLHLLIALSTIEGEAAPKGEETEEEANVANRTKKQHAMFGQWAERRKALEEQGRQRGERSDKGQPRPKGGRGVEEPAGVIKPSKRVQHASYADSNERAYSIEQYLAVIRAKQESFAEERENAKSASAKNEAAVQAAYFQGMIDSQRFLTGEIKKIPGLTKADFKVLEAKEVEEEESEDE